MCQNVKMIRMNADLYVRSDSCGVAKETVTITGMYVRLCASHDYISVPICQNPSSSRLGENELWVFLESLGPPPSSTQTLVAIAGL